MAVLGSKFDDIFRLFSDITRNAVDRYSVNVIKGRQKERR